MKIITLFCCFFLLGSMLSQAQPDGHGEHSMHRLSAVKKAKKLSKIQARTLHLSAHQGQKITAINNDMAKQIDAIRMKAGMDKNTRIEKIKALKEERNDRYKEVLTADQYKRWNDWEMKRRALRQEYHEQSKANKSAEKIARKQTDTLD